MYKVVYKLDQLLSGCGVQAARGKDKGVFKIRTLYPSKRAKPKHFLLRRFL